MSDHEKEERLMGLWAWIVAWAGFIGLYLWAWSKLSAIIRNQERKARQ